MERIAFVTGADRGLGLALCEGLLARGWRVLAGQYMPEWPALADLATRVNRPDGNRLVLIPLDVACEDSVRAAAALAAESAGHIDLVINNAAIYAVKTVGRTIREGQVFGDFDAQFSINAAGPIRVVEALLPLVERGAMRRLCFVSSEAGSIGAATRTSCYGYCMSKAALNMAVKIMFNHLRPEGYTFRLYHPGWMRTYMEGDKNTVADLEPEEAAVQALDYFIGESKYDEDNLVMRDGHGTAWPW